MTTYPGPWDAAYIESLYEQWKSDPGSVSRQWRLFFQGFELGAGSRPSLEAACDREAMRAQSRVESLVYRYRDIGHLLACLDPLVSCPTSHPLLEPGALGLGEADLDKEFHVPGLFGDAPATLREIIGGLRQTYCRSIGVEYMHLQDPEERRWLQQRMEPSRNTPDFAPERKLRILRKLCHAKRFEQFIHKKYLGQKRFSIEGCETLIPVLDALVGQAAAHGCTEIIMGMAHRGRLNVVANVLRKNYEDIFRQFEDAYNPHAEVGAGDVKYHKGHSSRVTTGPGGELRLVLPSNPSHVESVDPVVEGMVRALQDRTGKDAHKAVLALLMHGDAAFTGQGIVAETLNMSRLEGYGTGGTIHVIINNQIGYTTLPEDARSTRYATDIAKSLMIPVFHVHGEDPEAAVFVAMLACDYRMHFDKDVVIDLVGYRKYGHNEGDEPYFTQPDMYARIRQRQPVDRIYANRLTAAGILGEDDYRKINEEIDQCVEAEYDRAKGRDLPARVEISVPQDTDDLPPPETRMSVDTAVDTKTLLRLGRAVLEVPDGFHLHPKLKKLHEKQRSALEAGAGIDWSLGEALAFASIVDQGLPVRLSGEDSQRGTFSQRHCVLFDTENNAPYVPLDQLGKGRAGFSAFNSPLSEAGVLAFEYGYSLVQTRGLVVWEAQFGDFVNNAQAVVDLYIAAGEAKWGHLSGLVLLLPHGYEGQGPEHSSARFERFLQLAAGGNIQVCYPTTPAQYFHLLRRQAVGRVLKPLVVMTPKSLLRHKLSLSSTDDFAQKRFEPVLCGPDPGRDPERGLLLTGKLYYDLLEKIMETGRPAPALVRVEQLYPFPEKALGAAMEKYPSCRRWCWVQEEPENMGAWWYMEKRLRSAFSMEPEYIGRPAAASPATGYHFVHVREQRRIVEAALHETSA